MRRALTLALIGFLHAGMPAHAQGIPPADQREGPHDRPVSGVTSPDRVASEMEASARKDQEAGKSPLRRARIFRFSMRVTRAEFEALGRYTVFLLSVWTQRAEELPVNRVFIRTGGKEIPVHKVSSWETEVDKNSATAEMYGPYREDGFYLIPTGAMFRDGQLLVDLTANRTGWVMLQLPSRVAKPERFPNPDPAPGAKPDLKTLQDLIRRTFTGFPVPLALP
jgi:hypothetical protein